MINKIKSIIRKKESKDTDSSNTQILSKFSEEEIKLIAEYAINKISKDMELDDVSSKKKLIEKKEFSLILEIGGFILLGLCIWYWIWFFFIVRDYLALTYTPYIIVILISLTCINKFDSVLLNSITCIPVYGVLTITIMTIPTVNDINSLFRGPILHSLICTFQFFLIFHKKIIVSKRYLIWGLLFYLIFLSSYDTFSRFNIITGTKDNFPVLLTAVYSFYVLSLTVIGIYFYKKRYNILLS
ncbi:MAG: hypothetical protein ACFFAN_10050 [Promethearchaeota archaeon]